MNFKQLQERRKWRIRRNQTSGSLILALNQIKGKFQNASSRVAKSRRKLHVAKTKLRSMIAEYQKLEREVLQKKTDYERTMQQLETAIEESEKVDYNSPRGETLVTWYYSKNTLRRAYHFVEDVDRELSQRNLIASNEDDSKDNSFAAEIPMPCRITISNVDLSGAIERTGVAKLDVSGKCCVCFEKDINSIFHLCRHECCCFECATQLLEKDGKCPVCRRSATKIIKTYAM